VLQIIQESVIRIVIINIGSLYILFAFIELLTVFFSIQTVAFSLDSYLSRDKSFFPKLFL